MTKLDEAIAKFRDELTAEGATFLLVYTVKNVLTDSLDTRITSNSSQFGIRAILAAIMRPTEKAVALVTKALAESALAATEATTDAIEAALAEGAFEAGAKILFEQLRPFYTIAGWETEKPQQS